jgi:hypothetical protein
MAKIAEGAALIAGGIALDVLTAGLATPLTGIELSLATAAITSAIGIGASLTMAGIADALHHNLGTSVAIRQAAAPQTYVYGRSRVGGIMVYISLTGDSDKFLNIVVVHASNPCKGLPALYLDGKKVFFPGGAIAGTCDSANHFDDSGVEYNFNGDVFWDSRLGDNGAAQTSFADLTAFDPNWPGTANLAGHTCSYIRFKYDLKTFPNGMPGIRVDVVGKNDIYDPRTGTTGYSENWALCTADVLTNKVYGLQCDYATEIDEPQLIAAANICDEIIFLANGQSEPRYTVNGTISSDQAPGDILTQMDTAACGRRICIDGRWGIYPASYIATSLSFADADMIAPIKWAPKRKGRDKFNAVKGSFVCPTFPYVSAGPGLSYGQKINGIFDGAWQMTDVPPYGQDIQHGYPSDQNYIDDLSTRLWLDTRFPFTISVACAQRLMKILLLKNRQQGSGTITCNLSAYRALPLDVILLTHPRWASEGFTNKILEVSQLRFNFKIADNKPVALYVELDVQETDPSVYAWSSSEELAINDNPPPTLPNMQLAAPPSGMVLESDSSTMIVGADGIKRSTIQVTWTQPNDAWVTRGGHIEMQFKQTSAANFSAFAQFSGDTIEATINGVNDGINYTVQIRSANTSGAYSNWVQASITVSNANSTLKSTSITI